VSFYDGFTTDEELADIAERMKTAPGEAYATIRMCTLREVLRDREKDRADRASSRESEAGDRGIGRTD
jgi:hypothetical protein